MTKLRYLLTAALLFTMLSSPAFSSKYIQPAYITDLLFSTDVEKKGNIYLPKGVLIKMKAGNASTRIYMLMHIVMDKGLHKIVVKMLGDRGKQFRVLELDPVKSNRDNSIFHLLSSIEGPLPEGSIFFKVFDNHENKGDKALGTFRLLTSTK